MVDPYDSRQEWIANVFYEPPKVRAHPIIVQRVPSAESGMTAASIRRAMSGSRFMLRSDDRLGYLWLAMGAVLSLFAVHGRWDIPIAAWLSGVLLLRFVRTRSVVVGVVGAWLVGAVSAAFWLYESGLEVLDPTLLLCLTLSTVLVMPYLVDRLVAPRLGLMRPLLATVVFPLARVCCEYLNAEFSPAGNIFGSLAATQHDNLPLLQIAAITGSYGVSFLMAWFAAAANTVWERSATRAQSRTVAAAFITVLIAVLAGGGIRLAFFPPSASTVRVAGVSPSMAAVAHRDEILHRYSSFDELASAEPAVLGPALATINDDLLAASEREAGAGAKIIVWPEAGAGTLVEDKAGLIARAEALAQRHDVYLLVGLGLLSRRAPYMQNQAILIDPAGQVVWTYDKARPVPGMDQLSPGDGRVPSVDTPYGKLANLICFDADFPGLARQSQGVDMMLVPSNDWREFGAVHTQKATLRAIENGYSLVRQDTEGLAQVVDFQGHVLAASDYFTTDQQTMVAYVPTQGERTIYAMVVDVFAWLAVAALAVLIGETRSVRRSGAPDPAGVFVDRGRAHVDGRTK
jgi:apolipoprotein N-acyltransferase